MLVEDMGRYGTIDFNKGSDVQQQHWVHTLVYLGMVSRHPGLLGCRFATPRSTQVHSSKVLEYFFSGCKNKNTPGFMQTLFVP